MKASLLHEELSGWTDRLQQGIIAVNTTCTGNRTHKGVLLALAPLDKLAVRMDRMCARLDRLPSDYQVHDQLVLDSLRTVCTILDKALTDINSQVDGIRENPTMIDGIEVGKPLLLPLLKVLYLYEDISHEVYRFPYFVIS